MQISTIDRQPTMSTREIAELLGKQHSNIKVSAERLAEKGVIGTLAAQEFAHNGNTYTEYMLTKRDSLILVAQNCPEFTAIIVDRWQELEARQSPALPRTYIEALRQLADAEEERERLALKVEAQAPAVAFVERYVEARSSKAISDVAKLLGAKPHQFFAWLDEAGIIFKRAGNWLPHSAHAKMFDVKTGEKNGHAYMQSRFTPEGIEWVAGRWARREP
jgi:phage antirepressor YoqD-like protein